MAHAQAVLSHQLLDFAGQFEEANQVGDGSSFFSRTLSDFLMAQVILRREAIEGVSDFDGREIFALDVLDQSHLEKSVRGRIADHGWDSLKAGQARGSPSALAGNQMILLTGSLNNQGLNDAVCPNRLREFG